jgi:hypothetical protein
MRRGFIYPAWQFDPASGMPFPALRQLLAAAREARLDELSLHLFVVSTATEVAMSPADWIFHTELADLLAGVTAANAQGA